MSISCIPCARLLEPVVPLAVALAAEEVGAPVDTDGEVPVAPETLNFALLCDVFNGCTTSSGLGDVVMAEISDSAVFGADETGTFACTLTATATADGAA